jgi:hypothetical protein
MLLTRQQPGLIFSHAERTPEARSFEAEGLDSLASGEQKVRVPDDTR